MKTYWRIFKITLKERYIKVPLTRKMLFMYNIFFLTHSDWLARCKMCSKWSFQDNHLSSRKAKWRKSPLMCSREVPTKRYGWNRGREGSCMDESYQLIYYRWYCIHKEIVNIYMYILWRIDIVNKRILKAKR